MTWRHKGSVRPAEAAEILSVSERTLWVWIRKGLLRVVRPSARVTLVPVEEIERLLRGEVPPLEIPVSVRREVEKDLAELRRG